MSNVYNDFTNKGIQGIADHLKKLPSRLHNKVNKKLVELYNELYDELTPEEKTSCKSVKPDKIPGIKPSLYAKQLMDNYDKYVDKMIKQYNAKTAGCMSDPYCSSIEVMGSMYNNQLEFQQLVDNKYNNTIARIANYRKMYKEKARRYKLSKEIK